jgi:pimeloyl-ACP methyl ester carboxylesterase
MTEWTEFHDDSVKDSPVRGFLHRASGSDSDCLVLTHGAGANCQAPLLKALAEAFCAAGVTVLRCDLPFRQARPHGPPMRGAGERDQEGLRAAVAAMRRESPGRIFLGGHSYGGRQASMLAAAAPGLVERLLLLSYPLHPPKRGDQPPRGDEDSALSFSRNTGAVCERGAGWIWNESRDGDGAETHPVADGVDDDSRCGA